MVSHLRYPLAHTLQRGPRPGAGRPSLDGVCDFCYRWKVCPLHSLTVLAVKTLKKLLMLLGLIVLALGAAALWSYSDVVLRFPAGEKVVALTYDDGPNPPYTEALLFMLLRHEVKATFFLKGRNAEAFPEMVRLIAWVGHEIGNHGYSHRPLVSLDKSSMAEEVQRTNALIREQLGYEPVLFRPPYGAQGPGLKRALADLGMTSVLVSDHGLDWKETDPGKIAERVLSEVEPGAIILLHDGHGDVDNPHDQDSRAPTVKATEIIIKELKTRGYRFATVGEMIRKSQM